MKQIALTQGKFALVDDEDFEELNKYKWCATKRSNTFYAVRNEKFINGNLRQKNIYLHRQILNLTSTLPFVDHIDHNGLNCQRGNLRTCTQQENCRNRISRKNSTSKYKGVYFHIVKVKYYRKKTNDFKVTESKNWCAFIKMNGKNKNLGSFKTEAEAAKKYNEYALKLYNEFADLNKI